MSAAVDSGIDSAEQLDEGARQALRDLLLTLADSKRLLGIHYSDWMLGAPTLEAGIAASSMAQDEWGHARLTYALLSDFGDDPKHVEHEREAAEYHSPELLDRPLASWTEFIALALLLDTALTLQYGALLDSRYTPVHNRVQKLLDEEQFHFQYAAGWARRLTQSARLRGDFHSAVERILPDVLRWFGRDEAVQRLVTEGLVRRSSGQLRERFLGRMLPLLDGIKAPETLDWSGWNDAARRGGGSGPTTETLARVRGDKNRAMLLE